MTGKKKKQRSAQFKAQVAMVALTGEKTTAQLAAKFAVHPTTIGTWKQQMVKCAAEA